MGNKHTAEDLRQFQALPLGVKVAMTKSRIRGWINEFGTSGVYVSFSGGKDSTVLKHIVDSMYDNIPAVFVNTGLEYPEIQQFVREIKAGKYDCFSSNVEIIRPEMRFDEVVRKHGYPAIGKKQSNTISHARKNIEQGKYTLRVRHMGITPDEAEQMGLELPSEEMLARYEKTADGSMYNIPQYRNMLDADFRVSDLCCNEMKKKPMAKYHKETGRKPIIGTMASESMQRRSAWLKNGCNAFNANKPSSQPLSFWTEQDIFQYIKKYNVPICSVYGDIVPVPEDVEQIEGQMSIYETLEEYEGCKLQTTGCNRTGCIFCMFGCHLEKEPNRFQRLKETHPRQYEFCIGGGEYNEEGEWQPSKEGLGLGKVLDFLGVNYGGESMWKRATINGYDVSAKVYEEGSMYGINGGKISKLYIAKEKECYLNYDRGWDIELDADDTELIEVYNRVLEMWN